MGQKRRPPGYHVPPRRFCKVELGGREASALKEHDRLLPRHGLLPAELLLEAFDHHQMAIHDDAWRKSVCGDAASSRYQLSRATL